jgi:two-component system NtrC family sensor kinase
MKRRLRRLAPRLILTLTVLLLLVEGTFGVLNQNIAEHQLIDAVVTGTDQLSRSITAATWQAMLADRKNTAYAVMRTLAEEHEVERIRLFNREGEITFSTDGRIGERFSKEEAICAGCHGGPRTRSSLERDERVRILDREDGHRYVGITTPIFNEAACHACHSPDLSVLGVLEVETDLTRIDDRLSDLTLRTFLMSLTHAVTFGIVIFIFIRHFVGKPIRELMSATQAVSEGDLDQPIRLETETELGELAESFDRMRERLQSTRQELEEFTHRLEDKVEQRSRQLTEARQKLIRSDRMASLGQLAASVAHEVNNPISGVVNLTMLMQRIMKQGGIPPERREEFRGYLQQVAAETQRVGRIVSDLLAFSRRSSPQREETDLNQVIHRTLSLLAHKLELARAELRMELEPGLPRIHADRSQIEQVLLNLVMNAAEAMTDGGIVGIRTHSDDREVVLEVSDTGAGISEEHMARIFDPFFTTKEEGKGVGLGLSVVYGIIDAHGGSIDVESWPTGGTRFVVRLPLSHPKETNRA